jgi:rhodanese-related sulfurtransferase
MRALLAKLTVNERLALVAAVLGFGALAARPYSGNRAIVDVKEMAGLVAREADHVEPRELAQWILEGRADYRLIDLRESRDFEQYRIPEAQNVPLGTLADAQFDPREKLVLYSDGGTHGAQAWMLLRARGHRSVYNLKGGLDGWKDEILYPVLPESPTPDEREAVDRATALSRHFGGSPRSASGTSLAPAALPRPALPAVVPPSAAGGGSAPVRKKRKEGC